MHKLATAFRQLHEQSVPLVLANVWNCERQERPAPDLVLAHGGAPLGGFQPRDLIEKDGIHRAERARGPC